MIKDPICGMEIQREKALHKLYLEHDIVCFCSHHCLDIYIQKRNLSKTSKKKGAFARFLDKLAKDNEQTFGGSPPKCH